MFPFVQQAVQITELKCTTRKTTIQVESSLAEGPMIQKGLLANEMVALGAGNVLIFIFKLAFLHILPTPWWYKAGWKSAQIQKLWHKCQPPNYPDPGGGICCRGLWVWRVSAFEYSTDLRAQQDLQSCNFPPVSLLYIHASYESFVKTLFFTQAEWFSSALSLCPLRPFVAWYVPNLLTSEAHLYRCFSCQGGAHRRVVDI